MSDDRAGESSDAPEDRVGPRTARADRDGPKRDGLDADRLALWAIAGLILLGLWYFAWRFVGTLILGLFVYYVCRPLFVRIRTRVANRTLAVVVTLVTVALPVLFVVGWTLAVVIQAIADFLGSESSEQVAAIVEPYLDVSASVGEIEATVRQVAADPSQLGQQGAIGSTVAGLLDAVVASLVALGSVGLQAFIVLVVTFYLLRDDYRIAAWARRTFVAEGSVVERYLVRVDRDLKNVFFGNILNALVTGLIAVVSYLLLNLIAPEVVLIPQPALVGILVGVASLVPAIGIKLVTWPLGVYLLARSALVDPRTLWFPAVFFVVSSVVVDYVPDQLLRPYVSGRTLHVGAVMLAYLFGPLLFGWYGIFLGPFLLVVVFEFGRIVVPWLFDPEADPTRTVDSTSDPDPDSKPSNGDAAAQTPPSSADDSTTDDARNADRSSRDEDAAAD